jgi:hypothetical protein
MDILRQQLRPSADAVESGVGDETVLLHLKRGAYYGLDATGTRIWALLKEGRRPEEICVQLREEFGIDRETVEADVRAFLTDLMANEIILPA